MRPIRALLHPGWWFALLLLIGNDHLLKGAGVLPGALTGKLSDLAGLFFAPALLAVLLGVRGERGWWRSHVAVGAVFAAINLSRGFADLFCLVAPWRIWVDPTDLIALPMLWLSYHHLGDWSRRPLPTKPLLQRLGLGLGALACVATSPAPEPYEPYDAGPPPLYSFSAAAALRNLTQSEQVVALRRPASNLNWRCDEMRSAAFPTPREMFTEIETHLIPPGVAIPIYANNMRTLTGEPCAPILIEGAGFKDQLLVITQSMGNSRSFSEHRPDDGGYVDLAQDEDGALRLSGDNLQAFNGTVNRPEEACALPNPDARLDWSIDVSQSRATITDLRIGIDGCHRFTTDYEGFEEVFYACSPLSAPFTVGEAINIEATAGVLTISSERARWLLRVAQSGANDMGDSTACGAGWGACGIVRRADYVLDGERVEPGSRQRFEPGEVPYELGDCPGGAEHLLVRAEETLMGPCSALWVEETFICHLEAE